MLGKYIYGIVKNDVLPADGAAGSPSFLAPLENRKNQTLEIDGLSTVDFSTLSAVTANVEYKDYHSLPKEEVIKELGSQQQMIEKIMEQFTVLPVKFGTILKDEGEVRSVLEKGYSFLRDTLLKMEDKIELDLVCLWDEQKAAQMAYQESKRVRDCYTAGGRDSSDGGIESKIALGKSVANYLAAKGEELSSQILKVLKRLASGSCRHTLAGVNMLLNQAFLVEREDEERFNHALNKLDRKFADLINFRLVGPLPPYSFATVVIESLGKEEIEQAKELFDLGGEVNRDDVKQVYNRLAFKLHPDKGGDPLEFERVTRSYQLLRRFTEQGLVGVYLHKWEER